MHSLTLAYVTCRQQPHFDWFANTLKFQLARHPDLWVNCIVVDFYAQERPLSYVNDGIAVWSKPKPTPWQGKDRLTDHDAFAAANARNTAICLAMDDYVAMVDDSSALLPGWLDAVLEGMKEKRVVCGAYRKVRELKVDEAGNLTHWLPAIGDEGTDFRWKDGRPAPEPCADNWLYGCSFAAPLEALLTVNGFDECLDGLGFEDVCLGKRLVKAGYPLWYDQRMLTFESRENHADEPTWKRHNRPIPGHQDVAWEMLDWLNNNGPQARGTPDLKAIRGTLAKGELFPKHQGFYVWPDGKNLLGA